jgi:predicted alpha/beta superfamily hydrolase
MHVKLSSQLSGVCVAGLELWPNFNREAESPQRSLGVGMRWVGMKWRVLSLFGIFCVAVMGSSAQEVAPPIPQRLDIHSNVLKEDRVIWVRTPPGYQQSKSVYPVLYQTDAPGHVNETGSTIDFLVEHGRMPALIVVGIANTDRNRDLTPSHADMKNPDGTVNTFPTSGGADHFLDFIQTELIPEIEKRYRTAPYRIFAGHSFGGLFAIHALISRPDLFNAYIAVSPSLQWDDGHTLHQAQQFFANHGEVKKTLFFSLANEGSTDNPMGQNFEQLQKTLAAGAPKGLVWQSARYPDEDHGSTVLRAHYDGLRTVFSGWLVARDEKTGLQGGGLAGLEEHYRKLSERYGYSVTAPENMMNGLGYQLMGRKNLEEAIAVFKKNVELYPESANTYDSLGEGLEAAGKFDMAKQNFQKAIELGKKNNDGFLPEFEKHLERVTTEMKAADQKKPGSQ